MRPLTVSFLQFPLSGRRFVHLLQSIDLTCSYESYALAEHLIVNYTSFMGCYKFLRQLQPQPLPQEVFQVKVESILEIKMVVH